jgi:glycosyltransferase involved in cell wall biosynthesis
MKILWVKNDFLHPTTRGGQIRTLEMLRRLHQRHEIHYVAFEDGTQPDGVRLSSEYCSYRYPIKHRIPNKRSLGFLLQLARGLVSSTPVVIERYRSRAMEIQIDHLREQRDFDCVVSDFLYPAANISDLGRCVLFQHNVETLIWRRLAKHGSILPARLYFDRQAELTFEFERRICRSVRRVVAVSHPDAELMKNLFGVSEVVHVPTGVDIEAFSPPARIPKTTDLIFVGSMDWMPNIDGVTYFIREILPLIRRRRPTCSLTIAGRSPAPKVCGFATQDRGITVTGTVSDVRPYLWGSVLSIVPLRVGGGTRLKIYESMAAKVPVVSTIIGAEGLDVTSPENIRIADTPEDFAAHCIELLDDAAERHRTADAAWQLVNSHFSWDRVTDRFEDALRC